mmetsp:Transcript_6073/g.17040  ORF Transcript_6073/g.17040 Transcript_6073/m.17040 type:complete len:117 (+) Transcript_6073:750-1100(+)
MLPNRIIDPSHEETQDPAYLKWTVGSDIETMLTKEHEFASVKVSRALHTCVWEWDKMWNMMYQNPMSNIQGADPEAQDRAKEALMDFVTQQGSLSVHEPLLLSSAANLAVARGLPE